MTKRMKIVEHMKRTGQIADAPRLAQMRRDIATQRLKQRNFIDSALFQIELEPARTEPNGTTPAAKRINCNATFIVPFTELMSPGEMDVLHEVAL